MIKKKIYILIIILLIILLGVVTYLGFIKNDSTENYISTATTTTENEGNDNSILKLEKDLKESCEDTTIYQSIDKKYIIVNCYFKSVDDIDKSSEIGEIVGKNLANLKSYEGLELNMYLGNIVKTTINVDTKSQKVDENYQIWTLNNADSTQNDSNNISTTDTTKGEDIELTQGNYVVGEDVKAGKYDVIAINGTSGNISIAGNWHGILSDETNNYGWEKTYKNLTLKNGEVIKITNGLQVKLEAK